MIISFLIYKCNHVEATTPDSKYWQFSLMIEAKAAIINKQINKCNIFSIYSFQSNHAKVSPKVALPQAKDVLD